MPSEMMWQVPGSMHEPCDTDGAVRTQAEVDHRCCQNRIEELPYAKRSSDIRAHCSGREDSVKAPSGRVGHKTT